MTTTKSGLKYIDQKVGTGDAAVKGATVTVNYTGWLFVEKFVHHTHVMMEHGPMMIFAAVLLLAGLNLLAIGLLGELQVRHYHEPTRRAPYSVDRVIRAHSEEQSVPE